MRTCSKCGETKPLEEFYKDRSKGRDGRRANCRPCHLEQKRRYRAEHPGAELEQKRRHYAENREWYYERDRRRRARKANATVIDFAAADLIAFWDELDLTGCIYCNADHQHTDHLHPLSREGEHAPWNLRPSCEPCNLSKGAKLLPEWAPYRELRSLYPCPPS